MYSTVAELKRNGYDIRTMDVSDYRPAAQRYKIRAVPTFVYVVKGQEVKRVTGPVSESKLKSLWQRKNS